VCACDEAPLLPGGLYSLLARTRPADQIIVVNNASSDDTGAVAASIRGFTVVDEPKKGLVQARETARRHIHGDVVAYPWKTLVRCDNKWDAIARTLRANVDVAVMLYRNVDCLNSGRRPAFGER